MSIARRTTWIAFVLSLTTTSWGDGAGLTLSEFGQGTFRVYHTDDPTAEPVAWVWVVHTGVGPETREFWITRNTYAGPTGTLAATLIVKPVTVAVSHANYFAFRTWVINNGIADGNGVAATQFQAAYSHIVSRVPKDLATLN
jgi:hypothetical protein